jgi:hypothetical protein
MTPDDDVQESSSDLIPCKDPTAMAKAPETLNNYDERRDSLVVERKTTWPKDTKVTNAEKELLARKLHEHPKSATKLDYILCPTGLIRHITVTDDDVRRIFDQVDSETSSKGS